jgi:adhesin/invasin
LAFWGLLTLRRTKYWIEARASNRRPRIASGVRIAAVATVLLTTIAASGAPAESAGAVQATPTITLKLSPRTIVADGKSTTTATATVTKANGTPAPLANVVFSSNAGQSVGSTTNNQNGTYTATITSTTTAGKAKITAVDVSASTRLSAQATLTQVPGPGADIAVQLSPPSILADGASQSSATATVTDAFGNRVPGQTIAFSSSDAGIHFSAVTASADGTYSTTLTSSMTPGHATIMATEPVTKVSGQAMLTLATVASVASLSIAPSAPATNQIVTLIAIVTAPGSGSAPLGAITFENNGAAIAGCANQPAIAQAGQQLSQSVCQVAFRASTSPDDLDAVFTSRSSNVADSSATATLTVARSGTATGLDVSNPTVGIGSTATFTAHVTPDSFGSAVPSGSVAFFDGGQPITACARQPLTIAAASSSATCSISYKAAGDHSITARYSGDSNFTGSGSPSQSVTVHTLPPQVLGTIKATMQWTFATTASYTKIRTLVVNQAPTGAMISVTCHGAGCPFARRVNSVRRAARCTPTRTQTCPTRHPGTMDLQPSLRNRALKAGVHLVVTITRSKWIGKYYLFTIRAGRAPQVHIDCLAPGKTRPGVGC